MKQQLTCRFCGVTFDNAVSGCDFHCNQCAGQDRRICVGCGESRPLSDELPMLTIDELAEKTSDAYSYDAYTISGWRQSCAMLKRRGYTDDQIETIMRSKLTRWAGDSSNKRYGHYTSKDLERYLDKEGKDNIADMLGFK